MRRGNTQNEHTPFTTTVILLRSFVTLLFHLSRISSGSSGNNAHVRSLALYHPSTSANDHLQIGEKWSIIGSRHSPRHGDYTCYQHLTHPFPTNAKCVWMRIVFSRSGKWNSLSAGSFPLGICMTNDLLF